MLANAYVATYQCRGGSFAPSESVGSASGTHTQMSWKVDDLQATVATLRTRGVVFEEYDAPGLKTIDGVADIEGVIRARVSVSEAHGSEIARETCLASASRCADELITRAADAEVQSDGLPLEISGPKFGVPFDERDEGVQLKSRNRGAASSIVRI